MKTFLSSFGLGFTLMLQQIGGGASISGGAGMTSYVPPAPTIRSTQMASTVYGSSFARLSFPSGTMAGDLVVLQMAQQSGGATCYSADGAWTNLYTDGSVSYLSGTACYKQLSANDLTSTVQANFPNDGLGAISMTVFVGGRSVQNAFHLQSTSSTSPVTGPSVSATGTVTTLYFSANLNVGGAGGTITSNRGTQTSSSPVTISSSGNGSTGILYADTSSTGTYAPIYTYSSIGNAIVISEVVIQ